MNGNENTVLVGCEILCIPPETGLVACPLSSEEIEACKEHRQYEVGMLAGEKRVVKHIESYLEMFIQRLMGE